MAEYKLVRKSIVHLSILMLSAWTPQDPVRSSQHIESKTPTENHTLVFMKLLTGQDKDELFTGFFNKPAKDGIEITMVVSKSPADLAGLKEKDALTKIGDVEIKSDEDRQKALAAATAGEPVTIQFTRAGKSQKSSLIPVAYDDWKLFQKGERPVVGLQAPEFDVSEWIGDGGTLGKLRGKVVYVVFFQMH